MRVIVVCCAVLVACGGDKEEPAPRGAEVRKDAAAPAAPPAALTVDALLAAKRGVKPYDDWDAAWAHLTRTAGPPARIDGELRGWYLLQGEECFALEVVRDAAEARVESVMYGPFGKEASQFARCAH
ncbi:MAG TPA: hypothetical protein VMZ28_19430 [Kofleriaceae bacterium]|nr:hypothetical protein [Kofleriaceae bacterium]